MSSPDQRNYTPIDVYGFRKKHLFSTVEKNGQKTSKSMQGTNLLLIASVISLVLSLSYSLQNTLLSTNSRASEDIEMKKPAYFPQKTVISDIKTIPSEYNSEKIPTELLADINTKYGPLDTKNKKNFVLDKLIRYYIYQDVLKENSLEGPRDIPTNFDDMINQIPDMEKTVTDNLISKDHKYVTLDDVIKEKIGKFN